MSLRRQWRRFGLRVVSVSVFIMTHAGTRLFCRSSLASRFFFAFDLPLIVNCRFGWGTYILVHPTAQPGHRSVVPSTPAWPAHSVGNGSSSPYQSRWRTVPTNTPSAVSTPISESLTADNTDDDSELQTIPRSRLVCTPARS